MADAHDAPETRGHQGSSGDLSEVGSPGRRGRTPASVRVKQVLLIALGVVLAAIMTCLGLWQMRVFESQQEGSNQVRINEPVISWSAAPSHSQVMAQYGRRVTVSGTYEASTRVLVGTSWPLRVVEGVRLDSGETLAVVRGEVGRGVDVPNAPSGRVTLTGVLAASESTTETPAADLPRGVQPALRLEVLTQTWPEPLVPATLTLSQGDSSREGLEAAQPVLPNGDGGERNRGYAMQWWAFAIFTIVMSVVFARSLGRRRSR